MNLEQRKRWNKNDKWYPSIKVERPKIAEKYMLRI